MDSTEPRITVHRRDHGLSYRGRSIHAARGVHEHAESLCRQLLPDGGRVLELGAGSGALALRLRDAGYEVIATDLHPASDEILTLDLDDPTTWTEVSPPIGLVLCIETLEHLENPRAALRAIHGLMGGGGRLVVSTPNVTHPYSRLQFLLRGHPLLFGRDDYYDSGHITILPDWLLVEHLKSSRFEVESTTYAGFMGIEGRWRRLRYRVMTRFVRGLVRGPRHRDDGACTFIVASPSHTD